MEMRRIPRGTTVTILGLLSILSPAASAQRATATKDATTAADATSRIVTAAQALAASLDEAGRAKLQFPLEGPQTTRWSNLPSPMFERQGLRLADCTQAQRA